MSDNKPFVYVSLSRHDATGCIEAREEGDNKIVVSLKDDRGKRKDLYVNGIFTNVAQPEQIFQAAVLPMAERVLQGAPVCCVATLGGTGPQLFKQEGLAQLVLRHILTAIDSTTGALRIGLQCFLNDPARPTDLLKNVQQKVPDSMQWEHEEALEGQHFVFCASLDSAMRTLNTVLGAPSLTDLVQRLSFSLTIAVKKRSSKYPSKLTLLELRADACKYIPPTIMHMYEGNNWSADMVSRSLRGCRAFDCVLIGHCHSDALKYKHTDTAMWKDTQQVFDCLAAVRDLPAHMMVTSPPPSVSVVSPSPKQKHFKTDVVQSRDAQKVQVDVHLHMSEDDYRRSTSKAPPPLDRDSAQGAWTPQQERSAATFHNMSYPSPLDMSDAKIKEAEGHVSSLEKQLASVTKQRELEKEKLEVATEEAKKMANLAKMQTAEAEKNVATCQELQTEIDTLKARLKEVNHENMVAKQARDESVAEAEAARAELRRLKATVDDYEYDMGVAQKSNERRMKDVEEELGHMRHELAKSKDEKNAQTEELGHLRKELQKLNIERDDLEERLAHAKAVTSRQNRQLDCCSIESEETHKRFSIALEEQAVATIFWKTESEAAQRILNHTKLREMTRELTAAKKNVDLHIERVATTEDSLKAIEQSNLAAAASSRAEMADLLTQLRTISAERDKRTETANRLTSECNELSEKCKRLHDTVAEAEATIARLEKRAQEAEHQYDTEKASKTALQATAIRLEAEKNTLQENSHRLEAELRREENNHQDIKSGFQERIKKLETRLREAEGDLVTAKKESISLSSKELQEQLHKMTEHLQALELENENLMKLRAQDSDEMRELMNRLHAEVRERRESPRSDQEWAAGREASVTRRYASDEVLKLHSEIEERDAAILALKDKLAKATKGKTEAERRERLARRRVSEGSSGNSTSPSTSPAARHRAREIEAMELSRLRAELTALQQRTSLAADEVNNERRSASLAVNDALAEVEALKGTLKNNEKEIQTLRAEAKVAAQEYATMTDKYEQSLMAYQTQLQQVDEQWRSRERNWVGRHQALEVQVATITEQGRKLEADKAELEKHLEKQIEQHQLQLQQHQQLQQQQQQQHNLDEILSDSNRQLADSSRQLAEKSEFIASLQNQLREKEAEIDRLHHEVRERETEIGRLRYQIENMPEGGRQVQQIKEEAKRREELLLGQIRSLVSHSHEAGRSPIRESAKFRETKAVSPPLHKRVLSQMNPNAVAMNFKSRVPVPVMSPKSDSGSDESDDEHTRELKARLAAVEAQNSNLRIQREKERKRVDTQESGRLTESQRQLAAEAIRERSLSRTRPITSPASRNEGLRAQLDSLTMQVKKGNFDRNQVEAQLKQVLDAVKPGAKVKYNV